MFTLVLKILKTSFVMLSIVRFSNSAIRLGSHKHAKEHLIGMKTLSDPIVCFKSEGYQLLC